MIWGNGSSHYVGHEIVKAGHLDLYRVEIITLYWHYFAPFSLYCSDVLRSDSFAPLRREAGSPIPLSFLGGARLTLKSAISQNEGGIDRFYAMTHYLCDSSGLYVFRFGR
jgi:hypothetical protein